MTADPAQLRFYVDESALGIGKTLTCARKDTIHCGHPLIPECPCGALDTEWIPAVAQRGLIAIIRDKRIRRRPAERLALRDAGLRVFSIGGRGDATTWIWLGWLVRQWPRMEEKVDSDGPGPWLYVVNKGGLSRADL